MSNNLIWIDLEMTGLNPEINRIIEIAAVATDSNLSILGEINVVISQPDSVLDLMDTWNVTQHNKTGLVADIKSDSSLKEVDAMFQVLDFVSQYVERGATPLCGNSISHDRKFLSKYMAELDNYFHYRNIDVSSINELAKLWNPEILNDFGKKSNHRALSDIKESISELSFYKSKFFNLF